MSLSEVRGQPLPTEKQEADWIKSLEGAFPSHLRSLEKAFTKKLTAAQSPEAKAVWKRRLAMVQERLLGGPVEDKAPPKPVRMAPKPTMSIEEQQMAWEKAKETLNLPGKKAAASTAART